MIVLSLCDGATLFLLARATRSSKFEEAVVEFDDVSEIRIALDAGRLSRNERCFAGNETRATYAVLVEAEEDRLANLPF